MVTLVPFSMVVSRQSHLSESMHRLGHGPRRFVAKLRALTTKLDHGLIHESEYQLRAEALTAFVMPASTKQWRRAAIAMGTQALKLEPRESRR